MQVTAKGLTRELGYVGYYGEVLDWVSAIYDATRPEPGKPGDELIRQQLVKLALARAIFRYPALDADGCQAMRIESQVGWRDTHYPGNVCYLQRATRDGSPLMAAAATLDKTCIAYCQQMLAEGQFFSQIEGKMQEGGLRVTAGSLSTPDEYETITRQPASAGKMPMSNGQPDFVFTDEEDGVVAAKHGDEIFYASLYWRARHAVNFLAKVHLISPTIERVATVKEDILFTPSLSSYTRKDWINEGFGNGGPKYPMPPNSALAGEQLPIAEIPAGVKYKTGDENIYAGRGDLYTLRYGSWFVAMNMSATKSFDVAVPGGAAFKTVGGNGATAPSKI